jgi:hypothetical protein
MILCYATSSQPFRVHNPSGRVDEDVYTEYYEENALLLCNVVSTVL